MYHRTIGERSLTGVNHTAQPAGGRKGVARNESVLLARSTVQRPLRVSLLVNDNISVISDKVETRFNYICTRAVFPGLRIKPELRGILFHDSLEIP